MDSPIGSLPAPAAPAPDGPEQPAGRSGPSGAEQPAGASGPSEADQRELPQLREEGLRALGEMASGIAHDFNNALSPIIGFCELLLVRPDSLRDEEGAREYLRLMRTAAEDASHVVRRLRGVSLAAEASETLDPLDVNDLIEQTVVLTRPKWKDQAQAAGRTIQIEVDRQDVPPVLGSRSALRNVLTNLVFNAVDAMPDGGTITLRSGSEDDYVLLQVCDTGSGMPEEVRRRCLEPFFTTKREQGTGLGLAIVREVVREHHGLIDIWSLPDNGTVVSIRLPVSPGAAERTPEPVVAIGAVPPLRILIVDDEPLVRRLLSEYLAIDGHAVETATNGRHALDKFRAGRYDLVVTDRAMPEMNGDELAAAIRRLAFDEPVIMLTGFGDLMQAGDERPVGVDLVLSKPVTPAALRQAVATVAPAALRQAEKSDRERGPSKYVLVVDDDPWICDLIKTALESGGYEVAVAHDGLEALELVEERLPAVIVLDLMMPNMDGGTFADELRHRGLSERVPLIVVTAAAPVRRRIECTGAAVYLSKPFSLPTLLDEVARLSAASESDEHGEPELEVEGPPDDEPTDGRILSWSGAATRSD